jgi:hypothetical protein
LVEYKGINKKVKIICKEHGEFLQIASHHMNGGVCPKCGISCSKDEILWLKSFNNPNIISGYDKLIINGKRIRPDGYNPETKEVFEYYGDYWHGFPGKYKEDEINPTLGKTFGELYNKTMKREEMIKLAGYKVISIWESDFKKSLK